jgi:hypothetical protein
VIRSERLFKLEDSWFFTKFMEVNRNLFFIICRVGLLLGDVTILLIYLRLSKYNKMIISKRVLRREGSSSKGK